MSSVLLLEMSKNGLGYAIAELKKVLFEAGFKESSSWFLSLRKVEEIKAESEMADALFDFCHKLYGELNWQRKSLLCGSVEQIKFDCVFDRYNELQRDRIVRRIATEVDSIIESLVMGDFPHDRSCSSGIRIAWHSLQRIKHNYLSHCVMNGEKARVRRLLSYTARFLEREISIHCEHCEMLSARQKLLVILDDLAGPKEVINVFV